MLQDLKVGDIYDTKKELVKKLKDLAVEYHFQYKTYHSNKKYLIVKCLDPKCPWRLRAARVGKSTLFEVRKYENPHSCSISLHGKDHRNASADRIAKQVCSKYQDANRVYKPKDIIHDYKEVTGYEVSYTKAYIASRMAKEMLRGNPETCCEEIPKFLHLLKYANPSTITRLVRKNVYIKGDRNNVRIHFKYVFMALGQCIRGYRSSIRPVVTVDGTFLTSSYKGTLLVANCQDGNYQIYPLAFAIVDSENNASWTWFFKYLIEITDDNEDLVILFDRAASIKHGFNEVFKHAHHGFCTFHLQKNLRSKFPKSDVENLFMAAAKAYTVPEFENCFNALCSKNEEIRQYLVEEDWPYW